VRIGLVCSAGGHFYELYCLESLWKKYEKFWVTFKKEDTEFLLAGERVYWAYVPTTRHFKNFWRNLILAMKILRREKPQVIITTGAGVGVPFLLVGRFLGMKTVFIESMARVRRLSLSGRLVYWLADRFLVQWPDLAQRHRRALFRGQVI